MEIVAAIAVPVAIAALVSRAWACERAVIAEADRDYWKARALSGEQALEAGRGLAKVVEGICWCSEGSK